MEASETQKTHSAADKNLPSAPTDNKSVGPSLLKLLRSGFSGLPRMSAEPLQTVTIDQRGPGWLPI